MRNDSHREPRSHFICRRTQEILDSGPLNVLKFAHRVADIYLATIAPTHRVIEFYESTGTMKSLLRAQKNNGVLVDRFIKGVVRFPGDLEEAWIAALPEPSRTDLLRELAARYGQLGASIPDRTARQHVANLADVLRDAGEIAKAMAPLIADGLIAAHDRTHLRASLAETERMLCDITSLHAQLTKMLSDSKIKVVGAA
jgi:ubiquinone biosynthesis protein UbiJ